MCISWLSDDFFLLTLNIIIYRAICAPNDGKYVVYGLNTRDKIIWGNKWVGYQKTTTTCEGLGTLNYAYNKSTVGFSEHWKYILT